MASRSTIVRVLAVLAIVLVLPSAFLPVGPLVAEEPAADAGAEEAAAKTPFTEQISTTRHTITLDGERIPYTATAGNYVIADEEGKQRASIFFVAYVKEGVSDRGTRPVTFSFNGGPGAAAVWVHMGAFGPKKVAMTPEGFPLPPPGRLVDNPYSILDDTDLVFIDPVGTGYSRVAPGVDRKEFHGFEEDVESVGEFIRLWTTRNGRWASPKLIAGESYGTTRAAGLALHLQDHDGLYLNGIAMISSVLNWQNQEFNAGNDLPPMIHLPSYAATAWYHGQLAPELQARPLRDLLDEVEEYALTDYAVALNRGNTLPAAERRRVAEQVARYAGLSPAYVESTDLRVDIFRFLKELLRPEGKTVGRLDSRFTGYDRDSAGESLEFDPSSEAVNVGYVAALNDYLRHDLGYETDLRYRSLAWEVWPWSYDGQQNEYLNVAEHLRAAITRNPALQVLFTTGYYDFATPYFDTVYTVSHLGLPAELAGNVWIEYYEAGHMMYIREADHAKLARDMAELIRRATAAPGPAAAVP